MRRPEHPEIIHELGDGWAVVWDSTDIPDEVREAFAEALEEQHALP